MARSRFTESRWQTRACSRRSRRSVSAVTFCSPNQTTSPTLSPCPTTPTTASSGTWTIPPTAGGMPKPPWVVPTGIAYENYNQSVRNRYSQAPDLAGACFVAGYDFVNNDPPPNDDNSHGTHVAGTIAQRTNNSTGVAGLAYQSCLMPLKVLNSSGSGTYADIAEAIRWAADHGAKVINMSLGGPSGTSYLEDALKYAYDKGVTIVAAAGNDNSGTIR